MFGGVSVGTLWELAQEYRRNQIPIENRVKELKSELAHTASTEKRRQLRRRINILEDMLAESRRDVYDMEHYYDRSCDHGETKKDY